MCKPKARSLRSCESPGPSAGLLGHLHLEMALAAAKASLLSVFPLGDELEQFVQLPSWLLGPNPAWEALSRSGTQEPFQVILSFGRFLPGGFLLCEASPGFWNRPSCLGIVTDFLK